MLYFGRFLASGDSYSSLQFYFRLGKSTISAIVKDTYIKMWDILQPLYLKHLSTAEWLELASYFYIQTQFPNCIAAVDGKHIRIQKPPGSGSLYYNYKKYFSVILLAVADFHYRFVAVDIGAYGKTNESLQELQYWSNEFMDNRN